MKQPESVDAIPYAGSAENLFKSTGFSYIDFKV